MPHEDTGDTPDGTSAILGLVDEQGVQNLQAEQNSRLPISRLHTEILTSIFLLCAPDPKTWHSTSRDLAITHVCHLWREIALDCSMIWTRPIFLVPSLAREMISRSRQSLLDIYFLPMSPERTLKADPVLWEAVSCPHQMRRIRVLELHLNYKGPLWGDIISSLIQPMPSLQSLSIFFGLEPERQTVLMLSTKLLGGEPPSHLTRLCLSRCYVPWTFGSWSSNLTALHAEGFQYERPTEQAFYGVLQRSPQLEDVRLGVYALPRSTAMTPLTVKLPALKHLSLRSSISRSEVDNCSAVLNNIVFPVDTKVKITVIEHAFRSLSRPLTLFMPIVRSLSQHFQVSAGLQDIAIRSVSLFPCFGGGLDLQAWRTEMTSMETFDNHIFPLPQRRDLHDPELHLKLDVETDITAPSNDAVINATSAIIPSAFISTLYIGYPQIDFGPLLVPFMYSTQLKYLFIQNVWQVTQMLSVLCQASSEMLTMPALQELAFEGIEKWDVFLQNLIRYLDIRSLYGAPLPNVSFRNTSPIPYEVLRGWMVEGGPLDNSAFAPYELGRS
ncbi:hypothetical protein VNI00_004577 [Paramarasmius palmivorus]|uniref:F-box domain-containing protein n=1 Tax=Paramarasmius palmivorus TaxID=297713 RepID=A0AAW0DFF0_9AGAR